MSTVLTEKSIALQAVAMGVESIQHLKPGPIIVAMKDMIDQMPEDHVEVIIAHEIGHLALGHISAEEIDKRIDEDAEPAFGDNLQHEFDADDFAAIHSGHGKRVVADALETTTPIWIKMVEKFISTELADVCREYVKRDIANIARVIRMRG